MAPKLHFKVAPLQIHEEDSMSQPKAKLENTVSVKFWHGLADSIIKDPTNDLLTTEISRKQQNYKKGNSHELR